jgi:probable H4MPT-linked C1 transfer pathway protein
MDNLNILGLDIGGANTKAALIKFHDLEIIESFSYIEYFPFWEQSLTQIPKMFKRITSRIEKTTKIKMKNIHSIAITITAELSDAFQTKREGINVILNALDTIFDKHKMHFISTSSEFIDFNKAKNNYLAIAAANWVSTALFLGKYIPKCILIDAGSTTIDIIPILNSKPNTKGKTDVERLMNHELVYTGGLRATIPSITHFIPFRGNKIRISFEKFALISDIHRILGNITEEEYLNDTADNRSKSLDDCYARLARVICMDIETISKEELNQIAYYIYEKQLEIISLEIQEFMKSLTDRIPQFKENPQFIITGLSAQFLIKQTLKNLGYNKIYNYEDITKIPNRITSSAFAVAGAFYFQLKEVMKKDGSASTL